MKRWNVILGVDVSKLPLDVSSAFRGIHLQINNNRQGFAVFMKWCKNHGLDLQGTLVVMEHTGGYEHQFCQFCESIHVDYLRVSGLEIKNSMGIVRGKTDKDDSYRISKYGEQRMDELVPSPRLNQYILDIKQLLSFRKRLVRENASLKASVKERKHMYQSKKEDTITIISAGKIKANKNHLLHIERELTRLVMADKAILMNYRILTSIKGIGPVNAWMAIAYTENFTSFTDGRKYAVYAGVVPFKTRSGTSIKKKDRVSNIANKELKQELNQAAKTAMQHDPEIKAYATRKLEKKPYPLVLNNVKFKLILRMFSLVKRKEKYVEEYLRSA